MRVSWLAIEIMEPGVACNPMYAERLRREVTVAASCGRAHAGWTLPKLKLEPLKLQHVGFATIPAWRVSGLCHQMAVPLGPTRFYVDTTGERSCSGHQARSWRSARNSATLSPVKDNIIIRPYLLNADGTVVT